MKRKKMHRHLTERCLIFHYPMTLKKAWSFFTCLLLAVLDGICYPIIRIYLIIASLHFKQCTQLKCKWFYDNG